MKTDTLPAITCLLKKCAALSLLILAVCILAPGCSTILIRPSDIVPDGLYTIPAGQTYSSVSGSRAVPNVLVANREVLLYNNNDTLFISAADEAVPFRDSVDYVWPFNADVSRISLVNHSYDLDVFTTPFKLRFASNGIPAQMTTAFNASLYAGYRYDFYRIRKYRSRVAVPLSRVSRIGVGIGGFGGLGSALIKPEYVHNSIGYEYEAVTLNYGIAMLIGYRNLSTGIAAGFDHLSDRNRNNWIYQDKPWLGIFIGLNLN